VCVCVCMCTHTHTHTHTHICTHKYRQREQTWVALALYSIVEDTHLPDLDEAGTITAGDVRVKLGRAEVKQESHVSQRRRRNLLSDVLNSQFFRVFTMVSPYGDYV